MCARVNGSCLDYSGRKERSIFVAMILREIGGEGCVTQH